MLLKSHVLGDWADGRWSPGFKASLQNILKLCLLFKKIIYIIYLNIKNALSFIFLSRLYTSHICQKAGGIVQ